MGIEMEESEAEKTAREAVEREIMEYREQEMGKVWERLAQVRQVFEVPVEHLSGEELFLLEEMAFAGVEGGDVVVDEEGYVITSDAFEDGIGEKIEREGYFGIHSITDSDLWCENDEGRRSHEFAMRNREFRDVVNEPWYRTSRIN